MHWDGWSKNIKECYVSNTRHETDKSNKFNLQTSNTCGHSNNIQTNVRDRKHLTQVLKSSRNVYTASRQACTHARTPKKSYGHQSPETDTTILFVFLFSHTHNITCTHTHTLFTHKSKSHSLLSLMLANTIHTHTQKSGNR